ncbi:hypothetical protein PMAYCL1PPCAC_21967, partial [Pristionchus mayeri]
FLRECTGVLDTDNRWTWESCESEAPLGVHRYMCGSKYEIVSGATSRCAIGFNSTQYDCIKWNQNYGWIDEISDPNHTMRIDLGMQSLL